jgi:hypothetical protein
MLLWNRLKLVVPVVLCARAAYCQPTFTANDFVCFSTRYAQGSGYADCDANTRLNANDFVCFLNQYAVRAPYANCDGSGGGWTDLTPTGQVYYASATGSGLACTEAEPCSLSTGLLRLRQGFADQLLLKRGDTFSITEMQLAKDSEFIGEKYMVIGAYGTGPRPRIEGTEETVINLVSINGLALVSLDIGGTSVVGITVYGGNQNVLIEDCSIIGMRGAINSSGQAGTGPSIHNLKIRRNIFADSWSPNSQGGQLVFLGEQFNLLVEENVFDRAGRMGGEQNIFKHSLYIHDNNAGPATVIGNVHARSCADSVQQRPGGICVNNLSLQNPVGHTWGGGVFSWNVAIDGRDINPVDLRGIAYSLSGQGDVEYNIAAYQTSGTANTVAFDMQSFVGNFRWNYVWDWGTLVNHGWESAVQWNGSASGPVRFEGNILQQPTIGMLVRHESDPLSSRFTYVGNTYYTTTPTGGYGGYGQFSIGSGQMRDWNGWRTLAGEGGSNWAPTEVPDITVQRYLAVNGVSSGTDPINTFMMLCRAQSKQAWDERWTAAAFNRWARVRVGLPADPN